MRLLQTLVVWLGCIDLHVYGQSEMVCPTGCVCDADRMLVNCAGGGLSHIPVEEIPNGTRSLILDGNHIGEIGEGALSSLAPWLRTLSLADNYLESFSNATLAKLWRLKTLDLSGNFISDLPRMNLLSLRKLTLSRNDLGYLKADTFYGLSRLRELYLDQCSISSIQTGTFSNLPSLEKLSLDSNFLDADPVGWFVQTPLQELHLSNNRIPLTTDVTRWFGKNDTLNLRLLALASNGIQYLHEGVFRDLGSLEGLDLRDNRLFSIGKNAVLGLSGLTELRLDNNNLTVFHEESLIQTPELLVLTLDGNRLNSFSPQLFSPISRIRVLSAASNSLQDISDFNSLPALVSLHLTNNRIRKLPNLEMLKSLQILGLSTNEMTSIDAGAFRFNTELQEIYLDQNGLAFLDYELFGELQSLHTLTLYGNPWWCDCRLVWMQDLMWSNEQPPWAGNFAGEVECTEPNSLKGEFLQYVSLDILQQQCPDLHFGVAMIVALSLFFSVLGFLIVRFWIWKYINYYKFKRHVQKNMNYSGRWSSKRRPSRIKLSVGRLPVYFPLQRKGHVYLEMGTPDHRLYSETVV